MTEDCETIVRSRAHGTENIENTGEAARVAAVTAGEWTREVVAQRRKARSQMLWMVDQARHAAKNELFDDARWWREKAICALWNLN